MNAFAAIVIAIVAAEAFLFFAVCASARIVRSEKRADAILIPGARVWPDGSASKALSYRLDTALGLYKKGLAGRIIPLGGQGADEPAPEALIMKRWLVGKGVPEDRIVPETGSRNTIENLKNAKKLLLPGETVLIVTSDYHLARTLFVARILRINACGAPAPSVKRFPKWLEGRVRETISWQIMLVKLLFGKIK